MVQQQLTTEEPRSYQGREKPYSFMTFIGLGSLLLVSTALAGPLTSRRSLSEPPPTRELPAVAGMPYEQAQAIVKRHQSELMKVPGVYGVVAGNEGMLVAVIVYTNDKGEKPATLPPEIAALPTMIEGLPLKIQVQYILPPPPGFIVLKPGEEYEYADSCPKGYYETQHQGWRFCNNQAHPEPILPLMALPIAGIPYMEAMKIMQRHKAELMALPGVGAVGMGATGIYIEAEDPSVLPAQVEGLPLDVHPRPKDHPSVNSHSLSSPVRPVGGGLFFSAVSYGATATAAAFSCGMWLIFPAHVLDSCDSPSPCVIAPLDQCLNRYSINNIIIRQPQFSQPIGQIVKWTQEFDGATTIDAAAAWIDSDAQQGNNSLCVDRHIEGWGNWTGEEAIPKPGDVLGMVSAYDPHIIPVTVNYVDVPQPGVALGCVPSNPFATATLVHQVFITTNGRPFQDGDSGSPLVTQDGKIVGMFQWSWPPSSPFYGQGGGTMASYIRDGMGFSKWYGTTTFPSRSQVCQ